MRAYSVLLLILLCTFCSAQSEPEIVNEMKTRKVTVRCAPLPSPVAEAWQLEHRQAAGFVQPLRFVEDARRQHDFGGGASCVPNG